MGVLSLLTVRFFGYRYLGDRGTDWREILHCGTYVSSPLLGEMPPNGIA